MARLKISDYHTRVEAWLASKYPTITRGNPSEYPTITRGSGIGTPKISDYHTRNILLSHAGGALGPPNILLSHAGGNLNRFTFQCIAAFFESLTF
jgi:hypothetical protein